MTCLCFFNTTRFWGGGEKWHFETGCYLASHGHRVVFVVHPGGELHKRLVGINIEIFPLAASNLSFLNPFKIGKLLNLFRTKKIQTVIFNGSSDVKLGAMAARLSGVQAIVYRRGIAVPVKNSLLNRFLYGRVITHFLTNSKETARTMFKHLSFPSDSRKVRTIYNGIDCAVFANFAYERPKAVNGPIVLGNAGRLEEQKGHYYLLEMAALLMSWNIEFRMLIAGEGPLRQSLEEQIREKHLIEKVQLLGFVSDMKKFLRDLDIFVFPSLWEGFGYAIAEAMAAGLPVIAFNISSNPEVIEDGKTGILAHVKNIEDFTNRIIQLAGDTKLRASMGKEGRRRVCGMFDQDKQLRKVEAFLCEEVLYR